MNVEEKFGGYFNSDPSQDSLESIIEIHNLLEIPPNNGKCTWDNKRIGQSNIKERLDQILIQDNVIAKFNSVT